MTIEFQCPFCAKVLKTADDKAGGRAPCPGCGGMVTVPGPDGAESGFDSIFGASARADRADEEANSPRTEYNAGPSSGRPVADADTRICPMCGERIKQAAIRCRYCGEDLSSEWQERQMLAPHRGVVILVLAVLGWVICFPIGIAAVILARNDLKEMAAGRMDPQGEGVTKAGMIIAMIQAVLLAVGILFIGVMLAIAALQQ